MSTATLDAIAMGNAGPRATSVWRSLLWKDFRQVWPLIVGIAVTQASVQLLLGLLELTLRGDMRHASLNAINIALASPALLAIACSGVLIGQERQTGCWTWGSSLPVSWWHSLLSKVIIWFASSLVTIGLLLLMAGICLSMNQYSLWQQLFTQELGYTPLLGYGRWTYLMTVFIGFQAYIYCSLAMLLVKDTLMAIVIAAVGLFVFHVVVVLYAVELAMNHERTIVVAYLGAFALGVIWLAAAYRWRWGAGQHSSVLMWTGAANYARPPRAVRRSFAGSTQPSEFWMLMQHGISSSLGLRIAVVCGALLMIAASSEPGLSIVSAMLASCVLGVSVFSGDQTSNRFRFFADRGVHWKKLIVTHVALPALLAATITALATINVARLEPQTHLLWGLFILPIFLIGMFSSLVFASPIVSISIAIVMVFGAFAFSVSALNVWQVVAIGYHPAIMLWYPVSTLFLLVVMIRLVPRWLKKDRLDATGVYFGTMLIAGLAPLVLGLSFGFLLIPNVTWRGTPLEQIKVVDWSGGPGLLRSGIISERSSLTQHWDLQLGLTEGNVTARIRDQLSEEAESPDWFDERMNLLEAIENGGKEPEQVIYPSVGSMLSSMIEGSAAFALMATEQRKKDLAIRSWKANRKLIEFCQQPALQASTMPSVSFVWEIWNTLEEDELQFLVETNELPNLMPVPIPKPEQFNEVLQARATIHRIMMSGNARERASVAHHSTYSSSWRHSPFHFYPPIRWAYERQHAMALEQDLSGRQSHLIDYGGFHDYTVRAYPILKFLESNFAKRLEKNQ